MKRVIWIICMLMITGFGTENVFAASGKCTVVKVDGTKMILECNEKTKGFSKGSKIKIKSDKKKAVEGC
jgi:hypothetical protein